MAVEEPLEELLAELKAAIEAAEEGSGSRAEIARLADEVDRRLNEEDHDNLVDDLRREISEFQVEHPRLADAIGRAADALSALGL
ncbi:MAG: DUF4404 family protein [Actinomycetota bacterium]|jgi:hypothetical protein|nr:DUF4404 family protein [Actinomycetota bacterium]